MLIQFNTYAKGDVTLCPARQIACVSITPECASVRYISGQTESFDGDYKDIEDTLMQNGFIKGVANLYDKSHVYINAFAAQKLHITVQDGAYKVCASFPEDRYGHRNNHVTMYTSRKHVQQLYDGSKVIQATERKLSLAG